MVHGTQPPRRMRFSFESRCRLVSLVLAGQSPQAAAAACGASRATGYRLWRRYREGGWAALADRAPVPKCQPRRLPLELEQRILAAREAAKAGPLIVAGQLGLPASTVWKVLRRYGVSRLPRPARGPVVRYERVRTTEAKAKEVRGIIDGMITTAKRGDLAARRRLISQLPREPLIVEKLMGELSEKYAERSSGYTRIVKIGERLGDAAPLVQIELV